MDLVRTPLMIEITFYDAKNTFKINGKMINGVNLPFSNAKTEVYISDKLKGYRYILKSEEEMLKHLGNVLDFFPVSSSILEIKDCFYIDACVPKTVNFRNRSSSTVAINFGSGEVSIKPKENFIIQDTKNNYIKYIFFAKNSLHCRDFTDENLLDIIHW